MEETTLIERINSWIKQSVMLKLTGIVILILLLLIPSSMIKSIIYEREQLSEEARMEVSSSWAEGQLVSGPVLTVPLIYETRQDEKVSRITRYFHILPESLHLQGDVDPETLRRGIYEVVVYRSGIHASGEFSLEYSVDQDNLQEIRWDETFLTIGISDLRGIKEDIIVEWDNRSLRAQPGSRITDLIPSGVTIDLPDFEVSKIRNIPFRFKLQMQGSERLSFLPLGGTTHISLASDWPTPSFSGNFLPDQRDVADSGFHANWKILQLNRNFPQSWTGATYADEMRASSFGVNLLMPMDDYQKSMRSAKYAVMTIALTFLIFFLVEILNGRKIHPFQYTLVGLSLCLFYVLLISISEHSNFDLAYAISAVAVVSMITLYSLSVFHSRKLTGLLLVVLASIYGFLFVILQLADYALLMGSIGLAIILAATMYFTRNINWYHLNNKNS